MMSHAHANARCLAKLYLNLKLFVPSHFFHVPISIICKTIPLLCMAMNIVYMYSRPYSFSWYWTGTTCTVTCPAVEAHAGGYH